MENTHTHTHTHTPDIVCREGVMNDSVAVIAEADINQ